jgi:hypothetical protein
MPIDELIFISPQDLQVGTLRYTTTTAGSPSLRSGSHRVETLLRVLISVILPTASDCTYVIE